MKKQKREMASRVRSRPQKLAFENYCNCIFAGFSVEVEVVNGDETKLREKGYCSNLQEIIEIKDECLYCTKSKKERERVSHSITETRRQRIKKGRERNRKRHLEILKAQPNQKSIGEYGE